MMAQDLKLLFPSFGVARAMKTGDEAAGKARVVDDGLAVEKVVYEKAKKKKGF